jgi:phenylacetic acid degradation operon negative regulatory protein
MTCMYNELGRAVKVLVARFNGQRPLRAGSLIVTIFGDALLPRGGAVSLGSLIKLTAPFGLSERLVRTAASRLVHDGWLAARRIGKLSEYHLSATGRDRFAEATQRIYGASSPGWSGRWSLVVLPQLPAPKRKRIRENLSWLGFGEFAAGVFAHPELSGQSLSQIREAARGAEVIVFEADLAEADAAQKLVGLGWDLADLSEGYSRFINRFEPVLNAVSDGPPEQHEAAFVARTLLIHEYRKLHLRDPLLPQRLLSPQWAGTRAAECCRDIYFGLFQSSERYLSEVGATLTAALPAADPGVLKRFAG